MPTHKSAEKRLRQSEKRREQNRIHRGGSRTAMKKVRAAVEAGDKAKAEELLKQAQKIVATAANKNIYHRNNAARKISRLAKLVNQVS